MNNTEHELRNLMDLYCNKLEKLESERQEAKEDGDVESEVIVEVLQRLCRKLIAELFQTMKRLSVLDEEEIEFGGIKKTK